MRIFILINFFRSVFAHITYLRKLCYKENIIHLLIVKWIQVFSLHSTYFFPFHKHFSFQFRCCFFFVSDYSVYTNLVIIIDLWNCIHPYNTPAMEFSTSNSQIKVNYYLWRKTKRYLEKTLFLSVMIGWIDLLQRKRINMQESEYYYREYKLWSGSIVS